MSDTAVSTVPKDAVKVAAFPANYYEHAALSLFHKTTKDYSIDELAAQAKKLKANAPGNYVTALQKDLATLGYLGAKSATGVFDQATQRAVLRFQRHAARVYRMPGPADVEAKDTFKGTADGICNQATAKEIQTWIGKSWVLPRGRFALKKLTIKDTNNKLRADAADEWEAIAKLVADAGGTLDGPYGDTQRGLKKPSGNAGASNYSFHYAGRAVDINQGFGGGSKMRYYLEKEDVGGRTYFRIWCKTEKQDGTQGKEFKKGDVTCFLPYDESDYDIPKGYYIDLTSEIESRGTFERIPAQKGWDDTTLAKSKREKKLEWWHFQYKFDRQVTFLDELELIGFSEQELKTAGWATEAELDHAPG